MNEIQLFLNDNIKQFDYILTANAILKKYYELYPSDYLGSSWSEDVFPYLLKLNELQNTKYDDQSLRLIGSLLYNNKGQFLVLILLGKLFNIVFNKIRYTRSSLKVNLSILINTDLSELKVVLTKLFDRLLLFESSSYNIDLYITSLYVHQDLDINGSFFISRLIEPQEYDE